MKCKHQYTRIVKSGNATHYAKTICCDCHAFINWKSKDSYISQNLFVPFEDKDEAKRLGAKWDAYLKLWYAPTEYHLQALSRWVV